MARDEKLLAEVIVCLDGGRVSVELAEMFIVLVDCEANKSNYYKFPCLEDMKGKAILQLMRGWKQFNPELRDYPTGYFNQIIRGAFINEVHRQGKIAAEEKLMNRRMMEQAQVEELLKSAELGYN